MSYSRSGDPANTCLTGQDDAGVMTINALSPLCAPRIDLPYPSSMRSASCRRSLLGHLGMRAWSKPADRTGWRGLSTARDPGLGFSTRFWWSASQPVKARQVVPGFEYRRISGRREAAQFAQWTRPIGAPRLVFAHCLARIRGEAMSYDLNFNGGRRRSALRSACLADAAIDLRRADGKLAARSRGPCSTAPPLDRGRAK